MSRGALYVLTGSILLLGGAGCTRSLELDTISSFTEAMAEGDVAALKQDSSLSFQEKALRSDSAIDDLKLLRLPKGEVSIISEREVSETEKLVTVEVGKRKRKIRYTLVREDEDDKKWVVEDITVRQSSDGLKVAKSVSEQMDLLIAVREFLNAWNDGSRDDALNVATPEFRDILSELPAGYLARLTGQAVGERQAKSKLKPDVQMDEDVAVVTLPGDDGDLVISYRMQDDGWKVSDLAVESRKSGKHIASVAKMANVVRTTGSFLDAYSARDKSALKAAATRQFFKSSLAPADLSMVQLPTTLESLNDYEVTLQKNQADFVVRGETEIIRFNLLRAQGDEQSDRVPRFMVDEVTIYEIDGKQEKRLSALFTAHATMLVFSDALQNHNIPLIRKTASRDFNKRVWEQVDESLTSRNRKISMSYKTASRDFHQRIWEQIDGPSAGRMPTRKPEGSAPRVLSTIFDGAVTEITVMQGTRALTYVLRDENRQMRVDDVHMPVLNRPTSLKTNLELLIPIRDFMAGIDANDVDRLQRTSSEDMNRVVWRQTDSVPPAGHSVPRHLQLPMSAVKIGEEEALVVLGNARHGAQIKLLREHGKYVIDDVMLIAGAEASQRAQLKRALRTELAQRGSGAFSHRSSKMVARPTMPRQPARPPAVSRGSDVIPPPVVAPLEETFGSAPPQRDFSTIRPSAN